MNTMKVILAALIGSVISFLAGWLIYGMLLMDFMNNAMTAEAKAVNKTEPNLVGIYVGGLVTAFLYAYIFERWAKIRTLFGGITAGGLIGLLIATSMDIQFLAMLNMWREPSSILIDIAASTLMSCLIGGGIGWFLGYNRNDS